MPGKNPLEVIYQLHEAINQGDIETILTSFEPEATFVMGPATFAVGTDKLRTAFEEIRHSVPTLKNRNGKRDRGW